MLLGQDAEFLCAVARVPKSAYRLRHVSPSICLYPCNSHWMDFC